uniref:Uncharacterized protein n=1 Tax=Sphaerodactylus townsendi TaxID=933632 RepID=A0ACB8FZU5_9SAUR
MQAEGRCSTSDYSSTADSLGYFKTPPHVQWATLIGLLLGSPKATDGVFTCLFFRVPALPEGHSYFLMRLVLVLPPSPVVCVLRDLQAHRQLPRQRDIVLYCQNRALLMGSSWVHVQPQWISRRRKFIVQPADEPTGNDLSVSGTFCGLPQLLGAFWR